MSHDSPSTIESSPLRRCAIYARVSVAPTEQGELTWIAPRSSPANKVRWQGNGVPLGYALDHQQRLVAMPPEAELVKDIFRHYLAFETMNDLMTWIGQRGITTKKWVTRDGKQRGGRLMNRTTAYRILNNRIYIGEAFFHGEWHSGIYPPIVDLDLWRAVQGKLAQRARRKGVPNEGRNPLEFPLLGKLFWHTGEAYTAFGSDARGDKRYRYYVAPASAKQEVTSADQSFNLPTQEIHRIVANHLREQFRQPDAWLPGLLEHAHDHDEAAIRQALFDLDKAWNLFIEWTQADLLFRLISRVTIYPDRAGIQISMPALGQLVCEMAQGRHQGASQSGERPLHATLSGRTRQTSHKASWRVRSGQRVK